jgi:hypothetical protein
MRDISDIVRIVSDLPYPLAHNLTRLLADAKSRKDGDEVPTLAYSICALNGILVRLAAAIGIQSYVRMGEGATDIAINKKIVDGLRKPADGTWLNIATETLKAVATRTDAPLACRLQAIMGQTLGKKRKDGKLGTGSVSQGLADIVHFRNSKLIHSDSICESDIDDALDLILVIVEAFGFLKDYDLLVRLGNIGFRVGGDKPKPVAGICEDLPDSEPCLIRRDGKQGWLSLFPLLVFRENKPDGIVDFNEMFFLNAGSMEQLSYIAYRYRRQMDGRQLGTYEAFRKFLLEKIPAQPTPPDPRIDFSSLVADYTRLFVGRKDILEDIEQFVAMRPAAYGVVTAPGGMGKTAIFARLFDQRPGNPRNCWAFHFCMPSDGRDTPIVALRSLTAQVCETCKLGGNYLSNDIKEMEVNFGRALTDAGSRLPPGARLVIVVDAIDEGIPHGAQASIPSVLPDDVPDHVVIILSYRVDQDNRNTRVEDQLRHLPAGAQQPIRSANPLTGLTRDNVKEFLSSLANGESVPSRTIKKVWNAVTVSGSSGADPFFLRFIADGVQSGRMVVTRAETIPESLDDAFAELWMSLPSDRDFLVHRLLAMLAIMRDYGDDDMFAYLFSKDLPPDADELTATDIAMLRVQAGKLLLYDGDRYGLFHERFRHFLIGEQADSIQTHVERR